jgi:Fe-S-cluster containining protein
VIKKHLLLILSASELLYTCSPTIPRNIRDGLKICTHVITDCCLTFLGFAVVLIQQLRACNGFPRWSPDNFRPLGWLRHSVLRSLPHLGPDFGSKDQKWWEEQNGLSFDCTQCGRCCKTVGDVWFNGEEVLAAAELLGTSSEDFIAKYGQGETVEGWLRLKDKKSLEGDYGCIFLGDDGKTCSIYEARPTQCRTYPWWPRLIASPEAWAAESVAPDDEQDGLRRKWDPVGGGCEGISDAAARVRPSIIAQTVEEHAAYLRRFPVRQASFIPDVSPAAVGAERERIRQLREDDRHVVEAVQAWVKTIVVELGLCPFAQQALETAEFCVSHASSEEEATSDLIGEMQRVVDTPEDELSTSLVAFPLAFPDFEAYNEWATWLEDFVEGDELLGEHILVACFHPGHTFAGVDPDDSLHWEKRAPYPVVNILRAAAVDAAPASVTECIAENNAETLGQVTSEDLRQRMLKCLGEV